MVTQTSSTPALEAAGVMLNRQIEPGAQVGRLRIIIRGAVRGAGFRPCVYRLASELGLTGWVGNSAQGVTIEIEGPRQQLDAFLPRLQTGKPPRSSIYSVEASTCEPLGATSFVVRTSNESGAKTAIVLPDIATCPDCLRELNEPANRRCRYPFINCTNCGPRYSIIEALPYDRANTTMRRFRMCAACQAEYDNPLDRRFHAQPNACPDCGPQPALWDSRSVCLATQDAALRQAADAIRCGMIVAFKGLGGFQLLGDARDQATVLRLRWRKAHGDKPFVLMFPSLATIRNECDVAPEEARLLESPESLIVLLRGAFANDPCLTEIAPAVAPCSPYLGGRLPYTPLHHLLLSDLGFAIVAASGNLSDEPICTDEQAAIERLAGIAHLFLIHDRPIARHVDDSVARVLLGREQVLRCARVRAAAHPAWRSWSRQHAGCRGAPEKHGSAIGRRSSVCQPAYWRPGHSTGSPGFQRHCHQPLRSLRRGTYHRRARSAPRLREYAVCSTPHAARYYLLRRPRCSTTTRISWRAWLGQIASVARMAACDRLHVPGGAAAEKE